ncbi:hypothetical protein CDV50_00750 [Haematobacter massiliensis]|uniref:Uncharacterized protein n=1 Tax=Haematobacter massiliensis TaxID=195105 RepID=A0A086Y2N1_9RHOB|nr:hypothetical protein [Haematobacter massiliensis]KFI28531.1 hypothetical protein CN97_17435 [Haematobacter massiliensis]OWJ74012.1 hypothetical protein CDV50_00750 [Haematobacter massiliensis]OWJ85230.1 hypothetical protein CDV51_12375 [Haematobacter massiliensis]QBJ26083.1 hypothetical protein HmaOT1_17200 [Haematobacter massiliensis]
MAAPVEQVRATDIRDPGRSYVDWAAIFAGTVVAGGATVVMTAFAAGLGLGSIAIDDGDGGGISLLWLVVTALFTVIAMVGIYMLGGYIAGRMRRRVDGAVRDEVTARDGIHGLAVWGLGMLVGGMLAAGAISGGARAVGSAAGTVTEAAGTAVGGIAQGAGQLAGGVVSGAGQAVGGLVQGAGEAVAPAMQDMLPQGLQSNPMDYITDTLLRPGDQQPGFPGAANDPEATQRQIGGILMNIVQTGEISDEDRAFLRQQVAARTGLSEQEVDARVNQAVDRANEIRATAEQRLQEAQQQAEQLRAEAEQRFEEAKQQAAEAAEAARKATILTAFLLAAASLVAGAAAYIGAVHGGRHRDEGRIWGGLFYNR